MNIPPTLHRLRFLVFLLPLFALACNGSSPTEPVAQTQTKAAAAVVAQDQAAPAAPTDEASAEESSPGVARLRALRAAAETGETASGITGVADEARGGKPNGRGNGRGGNGNGNGGGNGNGNGGNGGGNGNGNGGNGGNGGGGGRRGELSFEIHPDTWNTNWTHAQGNVQAFVRGQDAVKIDAGSVELVAPNGDTLAPRSTRIAGGQLVATFDKADAFDLLGDDVHPGDRLTLTLRFDVGTDAKELTDQIRIVGPEPGDDDDDDEEEGELQLNIQPDDWNTNWAHSAGQVHAFLRGPGLADIDLATIRLVGDLATATPLAPLDVRRVGHQIVARFAKRAAFNTLDDPDSGETHTVKIRFMQAGVLTELSEDVHIVGP
jgi:hypothetical protein